jgi:demethylmenaquinone methyltransferase/2-methoxy-6-polyprenyl-1,4-benzoquinol methylase
LATGETVGSERKRNALALFAGLQDRYDLLSAALSFGQDPRWRRAMVAAVAAGPTERVLDVATGTGLVARELVRRYGCSVVGLDQSAEMLAGARRRLGAEPALAQRIELVRGEAERLEFAEAEFDHLTFTYLLRYVDDPGATLAGLARVVRPGGRIASLEFGLPEPPIWRPLWWLYTRIGLPGLGRLFGRDWYEVGRFLGPSIEALYERWPLDRQRELWASAGISEVRQRRMSLGGGVVTWGVRDE